MKNPARHMKSLVRRSLRSENCTGSLERYTGRTVRRNVTGERGTATQNPISAKHSSRRNSLEAPNTRSSSFHNRSSGLPVATAETSNRDKALHNSAPNCLEVLLRGNLRKAPAQ